MRHRDQSRPVFSVTLRHGFFALTRKHRVPQREFWQSAFRRTRPSCHIQLLWWPHSEFFRPVNVIDMLTPDVMVEVNPKLIAGRHWLLMLRKFWCFSEKSSESSCKLNLSTVQSFNACFLSLILVHLQQSLVCDIVDESEKHRCC